MNVFRKKINQFYIWICSSWKSFFLPFQSIYLYIENLFAPFQKEYQLNTCNLKRLIRTIFNSKWNKISFLCYKIFYIWNNVANCKSLFIDNFYLNKRVYQSISPFTVNCFLQCAYELNKSIKKKIAIDFFSLNLFDLGNWIFFTLGLSVL